MVSLVHTNKYDTINVIYPTSVNNYFVVHIPSSLHQLNQCNMLNDIIEMSHWNFSSIVAVYNNNSAHIFLSLSVIVSFSCFVLSVYPFGSHFKDSFIFNTIACSVTYYWKENISDARLMKQQVFTSSWTYFISGEWVWNSIISGFFSLPIGTVHVIYIESPSPVMCRWHCWL